MARSIPSDRFELLVGAAVEVFIRQGYQRTQMSDVAEALGVAKGTLYLYVDSKEALFALALRHADRKAALDVPEQLPVSAPGEEALLEEIESALASRALTPKMFAALDGDPPENLSGELESVLVEAYDVCAANCRSIKLVDRCSADHPHLAEVWFKQGREGLMGLFLEYLALRPDLAREYEDKDVVARLIVETIAFWTVHRRWDPHPQIVEDSAVKQTVVDFLVRALVCEAKDHRGSDHE